MTRNAAISFRYLLGETIPSLAREYGISHQRTYKLATACGERRARLFPTGPRPLTRRVIALRERGVSYPAIFELTGLLSGDISTLLKRHRPDLMARRVV